MAAVSCLPSHGSSSHVSCCPPLKGTPSIEAPPPILPLGMHPDDRSLSSHGSVDSTSLADDVGGLIRSVSKLESTEVRSLDMDESVVASRSSVDPMTRDSSGFLLHSSPTSNACRSSLKCRGSICSSVEQHFHSRFGYRLHKPLISSSFGFLMMFIFILGYHTAAAAAVCDNLNYNATHEDLLTCEQREVKFQAENGKFPVIDISNFTQQNFTDFNTVKDGYPGDTRMFIGNLRVVDSELTSITIGLNSRDDTPQFFELKRNSRLEDVTMTTQTVSKGFIRFNIRGNKILSITSLEAMKALKFLTNDSYIQDFGECHGTDIASFTDLEGCHYISGDLTFTLGTTNAELDLKNFPSTLTDVKGCIVIQNTSITNVDFIRRLAQLKTNCPTKNVVRYNNDLCVYSEKKRYLDINVREFIFEDNNDCEDVCTWNWALANRRNPFIQCAVIQGDVNINGSQFGKEYEMLYTVKMIMGQLTIHGNSFENFTIFKKLLKVDSTDSTKPAIHIYENPNMKLLELPVLREIARPPSDVPLLVVEDNHEDLQFSKRQHTRLSKLGKIEIPVGEPATTTTVATTTRVRATTSSSSLRSRSSVGFLAWCSTLIYVLLR